MPAPPTAPGRGSHRCRTEHDRLDRFLPHSTADRSDELEHGQRRLVAEVEGGAGDPVRPDRLGQEETAVAASRTYGESRTKLPSLRGRPLVAQERANRTIRLQLRRAAVDVAAACDRWRPRVVTTRDQVATPSRPRRDGVRPAACPRCRAAHRSRRTPCRSKRRRRAARGRRGGGRPRAGCTCTGRSTPRCRAARAGQRRRRLRPEMEDRVGRAG